MSRELVIGASGLIGSYLMTALREAGRPATGTYFSQAADGLVPLDIRDDAQTDALLSAENPAAIYLPAAVPNVEWIEENPRESRLVNVEPTLRLIERLRGSRCRLVYYSTDYVFDGANGPYAENDVPNPESEYGRQKLEVERVIENRLDDYLILRVTVVYGWEKTAKNFAHRMIRNFRAGSTTLRVPVDQIGSPSYAPNIAEASVRLAAGAPSGIYHVAGAELADRFDFAREIARVFALPTDGITPVLTSVLQQKARRPLKAGMIIDRAQRYLDGPLLGYREALLLMKESEPSDYA